MLKSILGILVLGLLIFSGCVKENDSPKVNKATIRGIEVTTPPQKLGYEWSDNIDLTGMVVTATYSDNSTTTVAITTGAISGYDTSRTGTETITVTYNGKVATFNIIMHDYFIAIKMNGSFIDWGNLANPEIDTSMRCRGDGIWTKEVEFKPDYQPASWVEEQAPKGTKANIAFVFSKSDINGKDMIYYKIINSGFVKVGENVVSITKIMNPNEFGNIYSYIEAGKKYLFTLDAKNCTVKIEEIM